jgi:hypothetical protein
MSSDRKRAKTVSDLGEVQTTARAQSPPSSPATSPRKSTDPSLSAMDPGSPKKRGRAPTLGEMSSQAPAPRRPPSSRVQSRKESAMTALKQSFGVTGTSSGAGKNDLTDFMLKPLQVSSNGMGYVTSETRREIKEKIEASRKTVDSLDDPVFPAPMRAMVKHKTFQETGVMQLTDRGPKDGFRSGEDWTITKNMGLDFGEKRTSADTPRPRSPPPQETGEELVPGLRYEKAHQAAYRFTRDAGTTVHAPTQANQVIDTSHEGFAASKPEGFVFRRDNYEGSEVFSARPTDSGKWEYQSSFTLRRKVKVPGKKPGNDNGPGSGQDN